MPKNNLRILANESGSDADTPAPIGVPGGELRISMGKEGLGGRWNVFSSTLSTGWRLAKGASAGFPALGSGLSFHPSLGEILKINK